MWLLFLVAGLCSGIFVGAGFGGGTILIPFLTLLLGVSQHVAQETNLLVFVLSSILAVVCHAKNKLLDFPVFLKLVVPAVCSSVLFAFVANFVDGKILRIVFGIFLICVAVFLLVLLFFQLRKEKKWTNKLGI